jgi:hypothetical protein
MVFSLYYIELKRVVMCTLCGREIKCFLNSLLLVESKDEDMDIIQARCQNEH